MLKSTRLSSFVYWTNPSRLERELKSYSMWLEACTAVKPAPGSLAAVRVRFAPMMACPPPRHVPSSSKSALRYNHATEHFERVGRRIELALIVDLEVVAVIAIATEQSPLKPRGLPVSGPPK